MLWNALWFKRNAPSKKHPLSLGGVRAGSGHAECDEKHRKMADEALARTHQAVGAYQKTVCALGSAGTRRLAVSGARSPRVHHAARRRGLRVSLCKRGGARRILRS